MARCKLTRMSLRNIRKDKQYQCIVIDFVRTGVISKSKAEELLSYTIPGGLLEGSLAAPDDDDDNNNDNNNESGNTGSGGQGSGGSETGGQGSSDSGNTDPTPVATIPVTVKVGTGSDDSGFVLDNEEYLSGNDGNNFVVEVPVNKTWNEAVAMVADAVDTYLAERGSSDSSWSWAGYHIEGNNAGETGPFYAVPRGITTYNDGEPTDWYFDASTSNLKALASLEQGFNMLLILTSDSDHWYHNADWFAAL